MAEYFGLNETVSVEEIANCLLSQYPDRWKDEHSCRNHIRGIISREFKMFPVNSNRPLLYTRTDALRMIEYIGSHWSRRKSGQITIESLESTEKPPEVKEYTRKDIARKLMAIYPNRWKDIDSASKYVGSVIREMEIQPIRKEFAGYRDDGQPKELFIYSLNDSKTIWNHIVNNHKEEDKKDVAPISATASELRRKCKIIGCSENEMIDKALKEYFQRHPYVGKPYQELVELLERRDAEREDMYR